MPLRQPLADVRRQQERLIPVNPAVTLSHHPILSSALPANPGTRYTGQPIPQQPPRREIAHRTSRTAPLHTGKHHDCRGVFGRIRPALNPLAWQFFRRSDLNITDLGDSSSCSRNYGVDQLRTIGMCAPMVPAYGSRFFRFR
jgi:hypothetical protein